MRFDLSDEEWAVLEPLMPEARKSGRADDRKIMNAIFYVLRTGMPWRDLPERYGPYTTAYNGGTAAARRTEEAKSAAAGENTQSGQHGDNRTPDEPIGQVAEANRGTAKEKTEDDRLHEPDVR